ncbi:uncharacterized protein V6R79_000394 [Siganus canaliculatus]
MTRLLAISCVLLCCLRPLHGKASEYQLEAESQCELLRGVAVARQQEDVPHCSADGGFRPVQCSGRSHSGRGQDCWCVNAEGQEVTGTRTNNSVPHCASPCQLQSVLRCSPSGVFEEVQCDSSRGQCWCVDQEGAELYGTRQSGTPRRCPGSCEVKTRRLLHASSGASSGASSSASSGAGSLPQCSEDGGFLPVQCHFINTTDGTELDLLQVYTRSPEVLDSFRVFRTSLSSVSSYCFCSDARGRELDDSGVELLLSDVYDSAFSGPPSGRSVSQTNVYRVLQRRLLGVRLALTGRFRCPSRCEAERAAAAASSSVFVPSCERGGAFSSRQCQQGEQCWCVDPSGAELPGTRQQADSVVCGLDCPSQRRLALAQLFSGPVDPPLQSSLSYASCLSLLRPVRDLLPVEADPVSFWSHLVEVLQGVFPSVGGALQALAGSSPRRLQENLFGGKFLKNIASFNFSGAVGGRGALAVDRLLSQTASLQKNRALVQSVSRALEDPALLSALRGALKGLDGSQPLDQVLDPLLRFCFRRPPDSNDGAAAIFVPRCTPSGAFQEVQCQGAECWCVDPQGLEVSGSRVAGRRPRCPSPCETQRATALKVKGSMAAGADVHVPACSEAGDFLPLQCVGSRCFCVDSEGRTTSSVPAGGAVTCPERKAPSVQPSAGPCAEALAEVTAFQRDLDNMAALSNSSHLPLGYGFLLAKGLRLSPQELQTVQSEEELLISDRLLSNSKAALRLAAFSAARPSSRPFTPQCRADGRWFHTQCFHSTAQCWCVDEDGGFVAGSLSGRSLQLPRCLTRCQRARAHTLLSGWTKSSYSSSCEEDGRFSVLQTGGAAGWCVNPHTGETLQAATRSAAGLLTCPSWCELQGSQCGPDGSFLPLQCDVTSCWCVSEDGQEVGGTRAPRQTGGTLSCDRPLCPAPPVTHGALVCSTAAGGRQSCDLTCHRGYQNSLPVSSFICHTESLQWDGDIAHLGGACQIPQPVQVVASSQLWALSSSCSQISSLQRLLFNTMTSRGLCSAQLPSSGHLVSLCDDSSVRLQCVDNAVILTITWTINLSDLPNSDLPHLHDISLFLNQSRLLDQVQVELRSSLASEPKLISMTAPTFGCSRGYRLSGDGGGCVVCPAGSFSSEGACLQCPQGTYQDQEGRDFCNKCPKGSSGAGASSVNQCVTPCQGRGLRCSEQGDFLPAQLDFLSGTWRCVNSEGAGLDWTDSDEPLTDEECSALNRFQSVPGSDLIHGAQDTQVLTTMTSDLRACVLACAVAPSCHHVALFRQRTQCELYSTHTLNTHCNTSQQTRGFLGNPQAERFDWLSCSLKVRGGASDLLVVRKKGAEWESSRQQQQEFVRTKMRKVTSGVFRTQVFSSRTTSLSDLHRFCQDGCSRDSCCHGFILNHNGLDGGSLLCGWLRAPSVLMCDDQDWDVTGQGTANRICGAGLNDNEQQRSFKFDFGGQIFTITDEDNQASITRLQTVFLRTDADSAQGSTSCGTVEPSPALDDSVRLRFRSLSEDDVVVDPQRKQPSLSFWLNKNNYNSQQALLWCLTRCDAESLCSVADLRDADSAGFFSCSLFPDSSVCGAYDKPLRRPCRLLLAWTPNITYSKTADLSGAVKSFYQRVSFQKMVSYSVRSRVNMGGNALLPQRFKECERRCDEDPCCRGIGFVWDTLSPGGSDVVCLTLISLGVQTCSEDDSTTWKTQDCSPSVVRTAPEPLGWYQKPVNQWTTSPALCPPFSLPSTTVSLDNWTLLADSSVLVDPALSTYDVIHVSRDIATDGDRTRDWCLHACEEAESCAAVSLSDVDSATRCILYPDTTACGLSSTPGSPSPTSSCRLLIKEPAPQVYLRTDRLPTVTSVSIPGHGTLQGVATETALGSDRKTVIQFLGVPFARPPVGALRFTAAQPADWTGSWDATAPRPSCVQPGDVDSAASSEDCLYLNVFSPAAALGRQRGRLPVLVFFFNPSGSQRPGLLDGSALAAVGNIVVVTASYRTAALGFLSTGSSGLHGNYGLSDQEAALRWVNAHISLMGGDNSRVTVGAERRGADISSLHLLTSSESSSQVHRMLLMGGSVFSPSLLQSPASSRRQAMDLATELGCVVDNEDNMAACLRAAPMNTLNAAQTKLLATSGPFQSWSPVRASVSQASLRGVDLMLGTSDHDGLIERARRIKDFEALQGRADGKTAFYEALSRSLGGATGNQLLKEAAAWFYSLDHSPSAAGYNLFSRALNNATRDLFITCPGLQMASSWANSKAKVFLYHQPATSAHSRADRSVPLDVQFMFGTPHDPMSSQRFTASDRRVSLALMTYVSSFIRTGNPNPSRMWAEWVLPRWMYVMSSEAPPLYLQLSPTLQQQQGLRNSACSFWSQLGTRLARLSGESGAEPVLSALTPVLPTAAPSSQSQTEKDAYS